MINQWEILRKKSTSRQVQQSGERSSGFGAMWCPIFRETHIWQSLLGLRPWGSLRLELDESWCKDHPKSWRLIRRMHAHALHRSHRPVASLFSVHASWLPFHHLFLRGHHAQLEQTHNGLAMQLQWILNLGLKNLNVQGDSYVLWSGFLSWSQGSHHNQWNRWPINTIGLLQTWKVDQLALSDFLPSTSCLHTLTARCVAAVQEIVGDGCCSQSSMKQMPATCVRSECI